MSALLNASIIGSVTILALTHYGKAIESMTPTLHNAVAYQEATIQTAENCELGCAIPARAQWEDNDHKRRAEAGIAQLELLAEEIRALVSSRLDLPETNAASTLFDPPAPTPSQ